MKEKELMKQDNEGNRTKKYYVLNFEVHYPLVKNKVNKV